MMKDDGAIDRLLSRNRRALDGDAPAGSCLDAETMAAWAAGALAPERRRAAEAHAADCARCLSVLAAMARTEPVPPTVSWSSRWLGTRWLVPVTAAATALFLWVLVDRPRDTDRVVALPVEQTTRPAETLAGEMRPVEPLLPVPAETSKRPAAPPRREVARAEPSGDAAAFIAPAPPLPAAPESQSARVAQERARTTEGQTALAEEVRVGPPSELAADAAAGPRLGMTRLAAPETREIVASTPAFRWRIVGTTIDRSVDGGRTWVRQPTGTDVPLVAGSAPSPTVCWIVGASGTVLLTTDGQTWSQVPFLDTADLAAVDAADALTATVTTGDARTYGTADGGRTWVLQETPAAPF